jgi:hypothetical protein
MLSKEIAKMSILDVLPQLPKLLKVQTDIENAAAEGGDMVEVENQMLQVDLNDPASVEAFNFLSVNLESRAEFYKKEAEYYLEIARKLSSLSKKHNEFLKNVMGDSGIKEIRGKSFRFSISPSKGKLVIDDESKLTEYTREVKELVIDKDRVKQDLELGVPVEGAHIEKGYTLRKYPIKGIE